MFNYHKVKPLHKMLSKTNPHVTDDDDLLKKHNTIWGNVSADIKNKLDSEPIYDKIFLKTKVKSHGYDVADF